MDDNGMKAISRSQDGWTQISKDYYVKDFGKHEDRARVVVSLFPNLYADEDDGMPVDKSWAMSAKEVGIHYHKLSTDDLEAAKVEALEVARQRAARLLAALT